MKNTLGVPLFITLNVYVDQPTHPVLINASDIIQVTVLELTRGNKYPQGGSYVETSHHGYCVKESVEEVGRRIQYAISIL